MGGTTNFSRPEVAIKGKRLRNKSKDVGRPVSTTPSASKAFVSKYHAHRVGVAMAKIADIQQASQDIENTLHAKKVQAILDQYPWVDTP